MKMFAAALSAALLVSTASLGMAQSKNNDNESSSNQKSDDCMPGVAQDNANTNGSIRCRIEEKPGTAVQSNDATGSTTEAPQRKHNMNDAVPDAEQP